MRRIYNEYESGKRISDIRNMLTSEEIPTPGGQRKWCDTTIERILSSEIYRGNYIYQRFHNGFTLVKERVKNTGSCRCILLKITIKELLILTNGKGSRT